MNAYQEEIQNTAIALNRMRVQSPEDYFYLKGWIHCLAQQEAEKGERKRQPPDKIG